MKNNLIDIDGMYEDLKEHNYDDEYKQALVKQEVLSFFSDFLSKYPGYNERGHETLMTMGKETSFLEFDVKNKKAKFLNVTQPFVMQLYNDCMDCLNRKISEELYDKDFVNYVGNCSGYSSHPSFDTPHDQAIEKFNKQNFKFKIPASKTILKNLNGYAYSNGFVKLDKYADYFSLKNMDNIMLSGRKIPKDYDQKPYIQANKTLKRDVVVQAFMQGYSFDDMSSYRYYKKESLQEAFFKEVSSFIFSYGECLRAFSNEPIFGRKYFTQNLATEFYSKPEKKTFTMNDANQDIRDIVFNLTMLEKYAPPELLGRNNNLSQTKQSNLTPSFDDDEPDFDDDEFGLNDD